MLGLSIMSIIGWHSRAPYPRRCFLSGLLALPLLVGCTPRLNWRDIRHPEGFWRASFPGKPVSYTRQLALQHTVEPQDPLITSQPHPSVSPLPAELSLPFSLTLWAVAIDEQRFTIGLAQPSRPASPVQLRRLALGLEQAMVRNISGTFSSAPRSGPPGNNPVPLEALGQVSLSASGALVPARLRMRTWVTAAHVVEALVVGPQISFEEEAVDQFLMSVSVDGSLG